MIVEIKIAQSTFKIECPLSEKEKIVSCANKLNQRVLKLINSLGEVDEKTALVICALMMQEEINNLHNKKIVDNSSTEKNDEKYSEDDMLEAVSENIDNLNNYINKLIDRVQDY